KQFTADDIINFKKLDCPPSTANQYAKRPETSCKVTNLVVTEKDGKPVRERILVYRLRGDLGKERIRNYTTGGAETPVTRLYEAGCIPDKANRYSQRFSHYEVYLLFNENASPEEADWFDERFNAMHIIQLKEWNVAPETANSFPEGFTADQVVNLCGLHQSPQLIRQYSDKFTPEEVCSICCSGLPPERIISEDGGISTLVLKLAKFIEGRDDFNLIGTGANGIVLLQNDRAWKFSERISHEFSLLNDIYQANRGVLHHVMNIRGEPIKDVALEIDYIDGETLEEIMRREKTLPAEKAKHYSRDMLEGLLEMREGGVLFHRDIRPANIMIDDEEDSAVIIDFGIATKKPDADPKDNRRFGGPNDLTSVGQILFYMLTGRHLFDKSSSMSRTFGSVADQINDERTKAYQDVSGDALAPYLKRIDDDIADANIADIIKSCLTAGSDDHENIMSSLPKREPARKSWLQKIGGLFKK
ncbi:MAG: phosphotransferase, partial [Nanoarchaeota archaeon]|nr:phosphotransferase [Nanoarchaeota archaeon]